MVEDYIHIADLVAFAEVKDLPPSLYPFVQIASCKEGRTADKKAHVIILKIRGTVDSYHALFVENGMSLEQINWRILNDLKVVRLSSDSKEVLNGLLRKFNNGEFTYFMRHDL